MNNVPYKLPHKSITAEEYDRICKERDKLNEIISEYENEFRRGRVKVIRSKGGYQRIDDVYSLRAQIPSSTSRWITIYSFNTLSEVAEFLEAMASDFTDVLNAIKNSLEEEKTNE